jgi:hypothetical protein
MIGVTETVQGTSYHLKGQFVKGGNFYLQMHSAA